MKLIPYYLLLLIAFKTLAQKQVLKEIFSLNGAWEIIYDDQNNGMDQRWFINDNFKSHDSIQTISVPSCWEEFNKDYEGVAFYKTTFTIPKSWEDRIIEINFEASNYKTELWVNDEVVGFHEGGYTPFKMRVDKLIKVGEINNLIVRVISPIILTDKKVDGLGRQEVPMWRGAITGGIWQDVTISSKGKLTIEDVFIQTNIYDKSVAYEITIENNKTIKQDTELEILISDHDNKTVHKKTIPLIFDPGLKTIKNVIELNDIKLWDIDSPYLYPTEIKLNYNNSISDTWSHRFGFREFNVKNDTFYLNNKPLYLKAAFFEGLYPTKLAYPDSKAMAIKEIKLAKQAGFNMIRPWRKPAPKMWLDLCDELGILTVGSLAIECMKRPISTPRLPFVVENELRKTILSNRNRTCIVQWELFNEINRPILTQMLHKMAMLARDLDPSRMILDESGGWGEGANLYLPYLKKQFKFNDVHHYSGSQINKREFNGYLVTGKNNAQKKELGLEKLRGFGKNIVPGKMTYISELGYGSTPNLKENISQFKTAGNPIVAPTIYHELLDKNYEKALAITGFDKVFQTTTAFYEAQQHIHGQANKRMIEASRLNNTIKGYCIHALTGGDWVLGAGLLDLWRQPKKEVYDLTKKANGKQIFPIQVNNRNIYSNEGFDLTINAVNELANEKGELKILIQDKDSNIFFKKSKSINLNHGISKVYSSHIETDNYDGEYIIKIIFKGNQKKLELENSYQIFIKNITKIAKPKNQIAIIDTNRELASFFEKNNIKYTYFSSKLDIATPLVIGSLESKKTYNKVMNDVMNFVKKGGKAIVLDVKGKNVKGFNRVLKNISKDQIPFNIELQGKWATLGGWAAKSHIVTNHPIFDGLPTNIIASGVYENVHPKSSMSKIEGDYIAGMIGYDHFPNNDIMVRHYNGPGEVWWAADILETKIDKGLLIFSTYDLLKNLNLDPIADIILTNMISYINNE